MEKETRKRIKSKLKLNSIITMLLFLALILSLLTSSFNFLKANEIAEKMIAKTEEANRPANLQITIITDSACADCFDVNSIIKKIREANVNIEEELIIERTDEEAGVLIEKFAIEKLPAFIIKGEIDKNSALKESLAKIGEIKDGAIVFKSALAPYIQASSGEIRGRVKLTVVSDEKCADCFDVNKYKNLATQMKMSIIEERTVEAKSVEGEAIIKENNIKLIPTIIISGDLNAYQIESLKKLGEIKGDTFVLTQLRPPYVDILSGELTGKIDLTILSDEKCADCYNIAAYDNIVKQFGLFVQNKKTVTVDSVEGRKLIKKYKIEAVPTIIMTGDVEVYNKPGSVWSGIGTTEKDGAYVLRETGIKQLGAYKNLVSGEIIGLEPSE